MLACWFVLQSWYDTLIKTWRVVQEEKSMMATRVHMQLTILSWAHVHVFEWPLTTNELTFIGIDVSENVSDIGLHPFGSFFLILLLHGVEAKPDRNLVANSTHQDDPGKVHVTQNDHTNAARFLRTVARYIALRGREEKRTTRITGSDLARNIGKLTAILWFGLGHGGDMHFCIKIRGCT